MTELTADQTRALVDLRASWIADWRSCEPMARPTIEAAVVEMYAAVRATAPRFVWVQSPAEAITTSIAIRDQLRVTMWQAAVRASNEALTQTGRHGREFPLFGPPVRDQVQTAFQALQSQQSMPLGMDLPKDALGLNFHYVHNIGQVPLAGAEIASTAFAAQLGLISPGPLWGALEMAARHIWHYYPFKDVCIIVDRPSAIVLDDTLRFHSLSGAVIRWRDGAEAFAVRGTFIPPRWIRDRDAIPVNDALRWPNIEQRRIATELIGWGRILDQIGATVVDANPNPQIGTLLRADLPDQSGALFLRVLCGTGREFVLPLPPGIRTALQGNAWTYNVSEETLLNLEART